MIMLLLMLMLLIRMPPHPRRRRRNKKREMNLMRTRRRAAAAATTTTTARAKSHVTKHLRLGVHPVMTQNITLELWRRLLLPMLLLLQMQQQLLHHHGASHPRLYPLSSSHEVDVTPSLFSEATVTLITIIHRISMFPCFHQVPLPRLAMFPIGEVAMTIIFMGLLARVIIMVAVPIAGIILIISTIHLLLLRRIILITPTTNIHNSTIIRTNTTLLHRLHLNRQDPPKRFVSAMSNPPMSQ
mmetsp:Transcript_30864/g.65304  ORF Transcript_30864/g.65304 Transcript_30864/m.65304 type:complete len:242 (-) Transcript_30864:443-1168(-)